MFRALLVEDGHVVETSSVEAVRAAHEAQRPLWVQLVEHDAEADQLLKLLNVHPLAVEDVWNELQIPKLEDFENFLQIIIHRVQDDCGLGEVRFDEVDVLIGHHFLVTRVHHEAATAAATKLVKSSSKLLLKGPAWVAHAVIDSVVDQYLPYVDHYEEAIGQIEKDLVEAARAKHPGNFAMRIFAMTRALQRFRRFAMQQEEVLSRLARSDFDEIPKAARPFYGDVKDHFLRVTNLADGSREVLSNLLEVYWSMQSSHMNEVMKTLTLMSTIMLPITFIAGVYGMNFERMPELHWLYGYPAALGLMGVVAVVIALYFRWKKWL